MIIKPIIRCAVLVIGIITINCVFAHCDEWSSSKPEQQKAREEAQKTKVADRKFWLLVSVNTASMVADYETTQSCLKRLTCKELNPIFGSKYPSRARMYAIGGALTGLSVYGSYRLKKKGKWYWWLPLAGSTVMHAYLARHNSQY